MIIEVSGTLLKASGVKYQTVFLLSLQYQIPPLLTPKPWRNPFISDDTDLP